MDSVKPDLVPETKFYAQITTALYLLVVITIGTASYMLNGPEFSAWYGSDQAIQVLMANDFSWPRDLYYWRQNRLGSIVPFFGYCFHLLGITTVTATGIAKYGFLFLGYFAAAGFLKTRFSKLILALAWFYSLATFATWTSLGHPYAENTALVLCAFALVERFFRMERQNSVSSHFLISAATICWMLALWVSDLTIALIPALGLQLLFHWSQSAYKNQASLIKEISGRVRSKISISLLTSFLIGLWFVLNAKHHAYHISEYSTLLASPESISGMIEHIIGQTWTFLIFDRGNTPQSIAVWGMIASVLLIALLSFTNQRGGKQEIMPAVFLLASVSVFGAVMVAYWSNNPFPVLHHYTSVFPFAWVAGLMWFERLPKRSFRILVLPILITVLTTVASGYWHKARHATESSPFQTAKEIQALGKASIIGDYWYSYIYASTSPDSVVATAYQGHTVRRIAQAHQLVKEPFVYLVKNNWFENFPDSIQQFKVLLIRDGEPFLLANATFCRFRSTPQPLID
jgi:hypothetical protein